MFIGKMLLFCVWRDSLFGDTLVRPYRWLGADMVSSGVILLLLRMVRVFFLTRLGLMKNFVKHGSPTSLARSGGMLACARGRGVCDPGGTKPLSTSTRYKVWRPTVGESALLQQASGRLPHEAWVGHVQSSSLRISQDVEIGPGCVVTVSRLPTPDFATSSLGRGAEARRWLGARSGVCFFRCALRGEGVLSAFQAAGDWVKKGSYHTAVVGTSTFFVSLLVLGRTGHVGT